MAISLVVSNNDIKVCFSCVNIKRRIEETIKNLRIDTSDRSKVTTYFDSPSDEVQFCFSDSQEVSLQSIEHVAFFFENTDYPLLVNALGDSEITDLAMCIAGHGQSKSAWSDVVNEQDGILYGTLNFHNQVGKTDFLFSYKVNGEYRELRFKTEVLSYKMDYRTDMKTLISDIEREFAMLSYSFLKQTYMSFREKAGISTDLIWWQIFQSCYNDIVDAAKTIIRQPHRRLHRTVTYEHADRLRFVAVENEREFAEFESESQHLYRVEQMEPTKDTVENRFLKYALTNISRRFDSIRNHILSVVKDAAKDNIGENLDEIQRNLQTLCRNPFFRGVGIFKGFVQDSLVMKQAHGYKDIYRNWIILQCGYEIEDGVRHLEVKDISELYEIWCFIKVKNIVADIIGPEVKVYAQNGQITNGFIYQLTKGERSEVVFKKGDVELACLSYNAQSELADNARHESAITGTNSFTTVQRPDIVLRLSKENDHIKYTYLFDAKYRIADNAINGHDVPPADAIDQMHRYRDAIYYKDSLDCSLKREIIGGYVLYPGTVKNSDFANTFYKDSIDNIGIGAFPLRPGQMILDEHGNLILDPESSENALREQIKAWLDDKQSRLHLLDSSIPQHGLLYNFDNVNIMNVLLHADSPDSRAKTISTGKLAIGLKTDAVGMQIIPFVSQIQYLLLHYWSNPDLFELVKQPTLVTPDHVPEGYIQRSPQGAEFFVLCDFNPVDSMSMEGVDYLHLQPKVKKNRYMPIITSVQELLKQTSELIVL